MSARGAGSAPGWYATRGRAHHWADQVGLAKARCGRSIVTMFRFPAAPPHGRLCAACLQALTREAVTGLIRDVLGPEALDFMDQADRR